MADQTAEQLHAEIAHLERLSLLVTDPRVRGEIRKMIEELERRLRELGAAGQSCTTLTDKLTSKYRGCSVYPKPRLLPESFWLRFLRRSCWTRVMVRPHTYVRA